MRIRLGSSYKESTNKNLIPNNEGMTEHVNREIEYNMTSSNKAYENALAADGVNILLFRKTEEGRRCTCKNSEPSSETTGGMYDEYKDKSQENTSIRVRGSWDNNNRQKNFHKETLGVDIGKITADDYSGRQEIANYSSTDQDEIEAFLNGPLDNRALQGGEGTTACGICFGTGFTNGLSLYRGIRMTFDTLNSTRKKFFSIDKGHRPYSFTTSSESVGQFVEWEFELPSFFLDVLSVQVRNNLSPASGVRLLIGRNGEFNLATKSYIKTLVGQPGKYTLRVEPFEAKQRNTVFTHVELSLQFSKWIKTQIPQLQSTTSYATPETLYNMQINLPPSVDKVGNEDIIVDYKYQKAWIITDITDLKTARNQILDWTLQTKSIATFDIRSLVKVTMDPTYALNFDGLQGDY